MTKKHKRIVIVAGSLAILIGIIAYLVITPDTLKDMTGVETEEISSLSVIKGEGEAVVYQTEDRAKISTFLDEMEKILIDLAGFSEPDDEEEGNALQYTVRFHDGYMTRSYYILDDTGRIFYGGRVYQAKLGSQTAARLEDLMKEW